jgi:hypothetical protein
MAIGNKRPFKKNAISGNFILLLLGLVILTTSWKKESAANLATVTKTVKLDSTILLAALKPTRVNIIPLVNEASSVASVGGQLRAKAKLQAYMDSLIISPAATIGLKRDAKAINENNTINGQRGKPSTLNRTINDSNFIIDETSKLRKVLPPDLPSDPDL